MRAAVLALLLVAAMVVTWALMGGPSPPHAPASASAPRPIPPPAPPPPAAARGPAEPPAGKGLRLTDATAASGLTFETFRGVRAGLIIEDMGPGVAVGDVDGDGDLDVYAVAVNALSLFKDRRAERAANALFLNDGRGVFARAPSSGAEHAGICMGAVLVDLDGDGALDLFVTCFGPDRLWRGGGDGTFSDATPGSGLGDPGFGAGAAFGDLDGDGDLDLYLPRYVRFDPRLPPAPPSASADVAAHGRDERARAVLSAEDRIYVTPPPYGVLPVNFRPEPNRVLRNDGGLRFTDVTEASGAADGAGRSLQAVIADLDGDGRQDVAVANDVSLHRLFLGRGDLTFEDASARVGFDDPRGGMGLLVEDLDGDGLLDVFATHFSTEDNGLWLGRRPDGGPWRLVPHERQAGLSEPSFGDVGWGVAAPDLDLDGRPDLFVANGHIRSPRASPAALGPQRDRVFRGREGGFVEDPQAVPGPPRASRGAVAADLDGDGDEDLLVADREGLRLLRNDQDAGGAWLKVRLQGPPGNRHGVGAVVTVAGRSKPVVAGGSYLSGPPTELVFGVGAGRAVRVEVRWPDGGRSAVEAAEPGRTLEVAR